MASSSSSLTGGGGYRSRFGDTTLTKVFVGGLAWETPTEELQRYFEQFGDILEAVIITDKNTGRSKGYGFVSSSSFFLKSKKKKILEIKDYPTNLTLPFLHDRKPQSTVWYGRPQNLNMWPAENILKLPTYFAYPRSLFFSSSSSVII